MSEETKIEWATHTFNPWIGCTKWSPGCLNCYAEKETRPRVLRSRGQETWGKGKPRVRTADSTWAQVKRWDRQVADKQFDAEVDRVDPGYGYEYPERPRVFPSMCDPFDAEVPIEWFLDYMRLIAETPHLDHLLLTKRPENWEKRVREALMHARAEFYVSRKADRGLALLLAWLGEAPAHVVRAPANVWMGTSVEDQVRADERIPALLKIPARVRFLSVEPLLEPVDLRLGKSEGDPSTTEPLRERGNLLHWVIVGGESGPKARACYSSWVRSLKEQCHGGGVPVFVKQLGAHIPDLPLHPIKHRKGGDMNEWPVDLRVREFPVVGQTGGLTSAVRRDA
jgi:protein gp37